MSVLLQNAFVLYCLAGLAGMVAHAVKKIGRKQTTSSLWTYFTTDFPYHTTSAVTTFVASAAALASTGQFDTVTPTMAAGLGFMAGFTIDSAMNKGA